MRSEELKQLHGINNEVVEIRNRIEKEKSFIREYHRKSEQHYLQVLEDYLQMCEREQLLLRRILREIDSPMLRKIMIQRFDNGESIAAMAMMNNYSETSIKRFIAAGIKELEELQLLQP